MDDVLERGVLDGHGGSGACCQAALPIWQTGQQLLAGSCEPAAGCLFDGTRYIPAGEAELTIGGIDNSCHLLLSQVTFHHLHTRT